MKANTFKLSRRSVVGSLGSIPFVSAMALPAGALNDWDAVIVGASPENILIAQNLEFAGKRVLVIDSKPRVGGSIFPRTSNISETNCQHPSAELVSECQYANPEIFGMPAQDVKLSSAPTEAKVVATRIDTFLERKAQAEHLASQLENNIRLNTAIEIAKSTPFGVEVKLSNGELFWATKVIYG